MASGIFPWVLRSQLPGRSVPSISSNNSLYFIRVDLSGFMNRSTSFIIVSIIPKSNPLPQGMRSAFGDVCAAGSFLVFIGVGGGEALPLVRIWPPIFGWARLAAIYCRARLLLYMAVRPGRGIRRSTRKAEISRACATARSADAWPERCPAAGWPDCGRVSNGPGAGPCPGLGRLHAGLSGGVSGGRHCWTQARRVGGHRHRGRRHLHRSLVRTAGLLLGLCRAGHTGDMAADRSAPPTARLAAGTS